MREILFRGKNADTGEWVYGAFIPDLLEVYQGDTQLDGFIKPFGRTKEERQMVEVERGTVGQYTGLTDKYGVKIFEGDVLKMEIKSNYINPLQAPLVFIGVCKFKDGAFGFSKQRAGIEEFTAFSSTTYNVEFEIIGNIHDNADLLGENNAKEQ